MIRDSNLMIFSMMYKNYCYLIMSFRLSSALLINQRYMNNIFLSILKQFVILYQNNILIFNNTREEYEQYVKKILKILEKVELQVNIKKYDFYIIEIKFLNLLVSINKI